MSINGELKPLSDTGITTGKVDKYMWTASKHYYQNLSTRDQRATLAIAAVLLLAVLIYALVLPSRNYYIKQQQSFTQAAALQQWLQTNASRLARAGQQPVVAAGAASKQSILSIVSDAAKAKGIELNRLEPQKDKVLITIDKADFSVLLQWLGQLQARHNIVAAEAFITRLSADKASVRLTVTR